MLTFVLDGKATLPAAPAPHRPVAIKDPDYQPDAKLAGEGVTVFHHHCHICHGVGATSGGMAPDLRASAATQSAETFDQIVRGGILIERGMPRFDHLSDRQVAGIRQYLRSRAQDLASDRSVAPTKPIRP